MKRVLRVAMVVATVWAAVPLLMRAQAPLQSGAAATQLRLGALLAAQGRYVEALDAYARLLVIDDPDVLTATRKGVVRTSLRTGDFSLAAEQSAKLIASTPHDPEVLSLRGDALWATGLFAEAADAYHESAALDPRQPRARRGVARSLAGQSRLSDALGEALMAVALAPGDAEAHQTLGQVYERMLRYQDAAREYTAVLGLLPLKDFEPQAALLRSQVAFLRSFGNKRPYEMRQPGSLEPQTIPFKDVRGKIVVRARVNGSELTDFVVDTGAEWTVLSQRAAQHFNVRPVVSTLSAGVGDIGLRGVQVGTIDSLDIGSLRLRNVPCLIKNPPLNGMPAREADSLSPPAFGMSMRIDYARHLLTLGKGLPEAPADFELPLYMNRLVTVRGLVDNDRAVNFLVDTGGEAISISSATARLLTKPPKARLIPLKVYGISGWDRSAYLLPGIELAFDEIRYYNFSVVVLNLEAPSVLLGYQLGGIVGHAFLSKYRVDLDLERSVLRLSREGQPLGMAP